MSGLGWPVLSFSLASGALGLPLFAVPGFSRLLGLKNWARLCWMCSLAAWLEALSFSVPWRWTAALAFVPGSAAGAGRLGRRNSSWALDPAGGRASSKIFAAFGAFWARRQGSCGAFFGQERAQRGIGEISGKKGKKHEKKT